VNLKGMSVWQRAKALISVANPAFRDELTKSAIKCGFITKGTVGVRWE
jgi:acyl-CoA hydrolase